jgi:hypothetical protein
MKKFIITLLLAGLPLATFAQSAAFSKFEDVDGIESITVNKEMFKMFSNIETSAVGEKAQSYLDIAEGIDYLKVFTTSEKKHKKEMKATVADYLKGNPLDELMSITDKDSKIKIYVKQGTEAGIIREGLVFIENDKRKEEAVLISFSGNINLNDIKGLKGLTGDKEEKGSK